MLLVLEGGLEVGVHVDNVLSVVVVAAGARRVGAETKDHKSLGGEELLTIPILVVVVTALAAFVLLDKLALLEFDRVSAEVHLDLAIVRILEATEGGGSAHEGGGVGGLFGVAGLLGGEGVGRGGGEEDCGEYELHGAASGGVFGGCVTNYGRWSWCWLLCESSSSKRCGGRSCRTRRTLSFSCTFSLI